MQGDKQNLKDEDINAALDKITRRIGRCRRRQAGRWLIFLEER